MAHRFNSTLLQTISQLPSEGSAEWLCRAKDSLEFLKINAQSDEVVIFALAPAVLIHAVLAPTSQVTPADPDDLLRSYVQLDDSWRIQRVYGGGEGHRIYLEPPLSSPGCKSLVGGEKLIYKRLFRGVHDGQSPIELSQKLVHSLDLHFVPERNAYCRLDQRGDIEDVIRIIRLDATPTWDGSVVVTILSRDLATYMTLAGMSLVFRFDFTRFVPRSFGGWGDHSRSQQRAPDLFYNAGENGHASYVNGCMIVRPTITVAGLIQAWQEEEDPKKREYATFKIFDRKNNVEVETSCAPECLSNYFQKSDLPWEISPAFFRPDVLHRFKADPEKYSLEDRSISCRGAWYLKSYDINEAGQVHAYIGDLANLPIEEQRYWQSFNEWPKGPISKRAYQSDILGEWGSDYDPLDSLKLTVRKLDDAPPAWWKRRGDDLMNAARYPATDSPLEWANEIMALDQLLVEGFQVKPLRALVKAKGTEVDSSWGSMRVLQEYLVTLGRTAEEAEAVMAPLRKLHALRNPLKGHGSTAERKSAERAARSAFGTLRNHYTALAAECDTAVNSILAAFGMDVTQ